MHNEKPVLNSIVTVDNKLELVLAIKNCGYKFKGMYEYFIIQSYEFKTSIDFIFTFVNKL